MDFYTLISLINGIVAIFFGLFVFSKNPKKATNITFFLMSIGVAIWSLSYAAWLSIGNSLDALFWSRILNLGATLIPIFYLHWILTILNTVKEKIIVLFFGYSLTAICVFYSFSPLYIKSVDQVLSFSFWPQAGFLYILFLIFGYFGLVLYGLNQLFKARKNIDDKEKKHQINYIILGSIFGFGGGATNFPLMFGLEIFPPIGQAFVVLYIVVFALATLKYHLFEIRIFLTEILVGTIAVCLLFLPFSMPTGELKILTTFILILFLIFGYYLIKATREETVRKEELEKISKLKSEFISIVSHQLRTPLAAIRGHASMIKHGDYGELNKDAMGAVNYIYDSSVRMIELVNSLLNISRIERGEVELKYSYFSVEDLIKECIEDVKISAKEKKLYLKFIKPKSALLQFHGDRDKIKNAINNLINNAILYTIKGGIVIKIIEENKMIKIEIKDTGVGIEKEEINKIFKSFSRGKSGTELFTQGTGLGLYVAKNFIEMHKGVLSVFSEGKDRGSVFIIKLPLNNNNLKI